MTLFKINFFLFILINISCESAIPNRLNAINYNSFQMTDHLNKTQIHSINYCYDFEKDIFYYRNNFSDTILYFYSTKSLQMDSLVTPKFNKSSIISMDSEVYVIDFCTNLMDKEPVVVLYKLIDRTLKKINTFKYVNDKGYPEIDMLFKLSESEILAYDLNNNMIYTLSTNASPVFQSKIISLDSIKDSIDYTWAGANLILELPNSQSKIFSIRNKIEVSLTNKYNLFGFDKDVFILGIDYNEIRLIQLTKEYKTSYNQLFAVKIPCYSTSIKIGINGAVWFCNGKIQILKW